MSRGQEQAAGALPRLRMWRLQGASWRAGPAASKRHRKAMAAWWHDRLAVHLLAVPCCSARLSGLTRHTMQAYRAASKAGPGAPGPS